MSLSERERERERSEVCEKAIVSAKKDKKTQRQK